MAMPDFDGSPETLIFDQKCGRYRRLSDSTSIYLRKFLHCLLKNPFKPFIAFLFNNTALTSPIYQTSERSYKISQCTKWPFI